MRALNLISWDIRFQLKYGFYFVYAVITVLYLFVISAIPDLWREKAAALMIFSDPAAMGLFFMGAIVLLEKNQRVLNALTTSPVKVSEYIFSKVISFGALSLLVALIITIVSGMGNLPLVLLGTAFASIIFTLLGIIMAVNINSLNQFFIAVVPIEIVCFVPALFYLFKAGPEFLMFYPVNICMEMIMGQRECFVPKLIILVSTVVLLFYFTHWHVSRMWKSVGGAKL